MVADEFKRRVADTTARWLRDAPWKVLLIFTAVAVLGVVMLLSPKTFVTDGYGRYRLRSVREVRVMGVVGVAIGAYGMVVVIRRSRT